jgi:hypothetical protein
VSSSQTTLSKFDLKAIAKQAGEEHCVLSYCQRERGLETNWNSVRGGTAVPHTAMPATIATVKTNHGMFQMGRILQCRSRDAVRRVEHYRGKLDEKSQINNKHSHKIAIFGVTAGRN